MAIPLQPPPVIASPDIIGAWQSHFAPPILYVGWLSKPTSLFPSLRILPLKDEAIPSPTLNQETASDIREHHFTIVRIVQIKEHRSSGDEPDMLSHPVEYHLISPRISSIYVSPHIATVSTTARERQGKQRGKCSIIGRFYLNRAYLNDLHVQQQSVVIRTIL